MDPQMMLPQALLLLLLLHLSPLGGGSHRLDGSDSALELFKEQKLLYYGQDKVSKRELALEPLHHDSDFGEAKPKDSNCGRRKLKPVRKPQNTNRKSSCFGQKLDRIGAHSGLGCNCELPFCGPGHTHPHSYGFHH